jgi:hypothetical protein
MLNEYDDIVSVYRLVEINCMSSEHIALSISRFKKSLKMILGMGTSYNGASTG